MERRNPVRLPGASSQLACLHAPKNEPIESQATDIACSGHMSKRVCTAPRLAHIAACLWCLKAYLHHLSMYLCCNQEDELGLPVPNIILQCTVTRGCTSVSRPKHWWRTLAYVSRAPLTSSFSGRASRFASLAMVISSSPVCRRTTRFASSITVLAERLLNCTDLCSETSYNGLPYGGPMTVARLPMTMAFWGICDLIHRNVLHLSFFSCEL